MQHTTARLGLFWCTGRSGIIFILRYNEFWCIDIKYQNFCMKYTFLNLETIWDVSAEFSQVYLSNLMMIMDLDYSNTKNERNEKRPFYFWMFKNVIFLATCFNTVRSPTSLLLLGTTFSGHVLQIEKSNLQF